MENKLWPSSSKQNAQLKVQGKREKATTHDNFFFFFWPSKIFADLNCAFIPPRFPHVCSSSVTCHKLLSWPCLLCPSNTVLALPAWHSAVGWDARLSKTRRTAPHHCPYFCWGGGLVQVGLGTESTASESEAVCKQTGKKKTTISLTWHELRSQTHVEPNSFVLLCLLSSMIWDKVWCWNPWESRAACWG